MITAKKLMLGSALVACVALAFFFYTKNNTPQKMPYTTEKPKRRSLTQQVSASGTIKAEDQVSVGSLIAGKVDKIFVDNNDHVKAGNVLLIIDDGIGDSAVKRGKAQLLEAEAALTYQKAFFKRQKALFDSGQLALNQFEKEQRDLDFALARRDQAAAQLEIEEKNYKNLFISSPVDGTIIAKRVDLGQMITSRLQATTLFDIAKDLHVMEAQVDVDEADVGMVKVGQKAMFTVDAFPKKDFISEVKKIEYLANIVENTVTYGTILEIKNPKLLLRPGMTTNVDITVSESKDALSVPNKAFRINKLKLQEYAKKNHITLEEINDKKIKNSLWVIENEIIRQTPVKTGTNDGKYTQIEAGLSEAENVLVEFFEPQQDRQFLKNFFRGSSIGR